MKKYFTTEILVLSAVFFIIIKIMNAHIERRKTQSEAIPLKVADSIVDNYKTLLYRSIDLNKKYNSMCDSLTKEVYALKNKK